MQTKVRWTPEEDACVKKLHDLKSPMTMFKAHLPGRTTVSIYARVNKLGLKREPRILPINIADFSLKLNKRQLEKDTAAIVAAGQKGGFFGIPGPAIKEHHEAFSPILRENSPFLAVEENPMQYNKMRESIKRIKGIELIPGDLFDVLEGYAKYRDPSKVALFSYGHLDFCKTAAVLIRDYKLYSNLQWLAKWSQLKTTFYLDISVACRCDEDKMYERFFQIYIPDIFAMCGWKVEDPRNCDTKFYKTYRDATPMANALYKMTKK